jgi:cytochrome c oxidase assembly protein subunit 15
MASRDRKPRSIFEEVGEAKAAPAPAGPARRRDSRRAIALWLGVLFALVVAMIAVGGLTRLTDSGLSITEWRPVTGAIPPLDATAWTAEFEKYRASPQYAEANAGMTIDEFRTIYWWEWGHRALGRLVGLVWAAGFVVFWLTRRLPPGWPPRLLALGALGGLQGAIGWWMVRSGLEPGMVSVASTRLAVHLGLAFVLLGLIAWYVMRLSRPEAELFQARRQRSEALIAWGTALAAVAFLQVVLGALVAGIDAGRSYVDWPLMAGEVLPSTAFEETPFWRNFLDDPALVQFNHRLVGYLLVALGLVAWLRSRRSALGHVRGAFAAMLAMLALQVVLGIVTVLHAAPLPLALVHQLGAVAAFTLILRARFAALYPRPERIARA